jgi:cell division protein ZapE
MPTRTDLRQHYAAALARHGYEPDRAQLHAVERLHDLGGRLRRARQPSTGPLRDMLQRLLDRQREPAVRGLYLWGGVGRGKTFLMDLFHAHAGVPSRREHFHRFMKDVHGRLRALRDQPDPLTLVADSMARDIRLMCLDELFVTDIADAMLLAGLFDGLFAAGVTIVVTSNAPPHDLYRDGLQRQRFLPAIALLEQHTEVLNVDGGADYRLRQLEHAPLYIDARAPDASRRMQQRFAELAVDTGIAGGCIDVENRSIPYLAATDEIVWFDFAAICDGPRSQADYIEIARDYHTVLVSGVPRFDTTLENQARRFIALVDEFYDRGVKLVLSAAAAPADLYAGDRLQFEFARTRSRLAEMQTHEYLARPHRP